MRPWLSLTFALLACGGPSPILEPPPEPETTADGPSVAGITLPRLPFGVSLDDEVMAGATARVVAALTMPSPRAPRGEVYEVEAWAEGELADWLRRRAEAVAEAQRALEPVRSGDDEGASVVASALLGLVYARFALDLRGLPVPEVFAADEARREAFHGALVSVAGPLWTRALDAFGSCASLASDVPGYALAPWRRYCDAEAEEAAALLPEPPSSPPPPASAQRPR